MGSADAQAGAGRRRGSPAESAGAQRQAAGGAANRRGGTEIMTRETKVGLVVSCSFLCLVGTVVYTKYMQGDGAASGTGAKAGGAPDVPADPMPTASDGKNGAAAPVLTTPPYSTPPMIDPNVQRAATEQTGATTSAPPAAPLPAADSTAFPGSAPTPPSTL